jgi:hypothetical protein
MLDELVMIGFISLGSIFFGGVYGISVPICLGAVVIYRIHKTGK